MTRPPTTWSDRVRELDEAVEKWLEPRRSPTLDRIFYGLSSAADHGMLWHAVGIGRAIAGRDPKIALRFSTALGIESAITNGAIKALFRRTRPQHHYVDDAPLPYKMRRPITSSFPSGHAATAFMCASVLSHRRRSKPAWFTLAALVAFSRVYVRLHHPSDVVAGAALGLALAPAARAIATPRTTES